MGSNWYLDKLKSPQWQRKRCEVLMRDNFTCAQCRSTDKQLHVHHLSYEYGKDPWDYPLENFETLCAECHKEETDLQRRFGKQIVEQLQKDKKLAKEFFDELLAEHKNILIQEAIAERDARIQKLVDNGATFDKEGHYYALDGKIYDEDGNPM